MMLKRLLNQRFDSYHLFNSRLLSHIVFWLIYYVAYSVIWSGSFGLKASFFLEFILLPVRMLAAYAVLLWLLPKFLAQKKYLGFFVYYALLLLSCAVLQRLFIFFFYEELLIQSNAALFDPASLFRAGMLINTTVLLVTSIKLLSMYLNANQTKAKTDRVEIKANRRTHIVETEQILYIEGLGNYVSYYLKNSEKLVSYISLKKAMTDLPDNFLRVHKSFIINRDHIESFSAEDIQIGDKTVPRGAKVEDFELKAQILNKKDPLLI